MTTTTRGELEEDTETEGCEEVYGDDGNYEEQTDNDNDKQVDEEGA